MSSKSSKVDGKDPFTGLVVHDHKFSVPPSPRSSLQRTVAVDQKVAGYSVPLSPISRRSIAFSPLSRNRRGSLSKTQLSKISSGAGEPGFAHSFSHLDLDAPQGEIQMGHQSLSALSPSRRLQNFHGSLGRLDLNDDDEERRMKRRLQRRRRRQSGQSSELAKKPPKQTNGAASKQTKQSMNDLLL